MVEVSPSKMFIPFPKAQQETHWCLGEEVKIFLLEEEADGSLGIVVFNFERHQL